MIKTLIFIVYVCYTYIMKRYYLNKKEILYWANKARKHLKLPPILIEIEKFLNVGNTKNSFIVHTDCSSQKIKIILSQVASNLIISGTLGIKYNLSRKETLLFAIFHEIAHYFQFFRYKRWFNFYSEFYEINYCEYSHNQQKLENNANKIAFILFKELYCLDRFDKK